MFAFSQTFHKRNAFRIHESVLSLNVSRMHTSQDENAKLKVRLIVRSLRMSVSFAYRFSNRAMRPILPKHGRPFPSDHVLFDWNCADELIPATKSTQFARIENRIACPPIIITHNHVNGMSGFYRTWKLGILIWEIEREQWFFLVI